MKIKKFSHSVMDRYKKMQESGGGDWKENYYKKY